MNAFWQEKSLQQMTPREWELVCDGCGKCCLHKIVDEASDSPAALSEVYFTDVACRLLNSKTCECRHYQKRTHYVPDCVVLTPATIDDIYFMPPSCSYRRLLEGRGLPSWHPLLNNGKKTAMHLAGMSVRGKVVSEDEVSERYLEDRIVTWPLADVD